MVKKISLLTLTSLLLLMGCQTQNSNHSDRSYDSDISNSSFCEHDFVLSYQNDTPTIIAPQEEVYICTICGEEKVDNRLYDLNEFVFEDMTFMYDGQSHEVVIKGMLPLGTHVIYKNNSLTEIGEKEATASLYDAQDNLIIEKTAKIKIIANTGFANIRVNTNGVNITDKENYVNMTLSTDNCDDIYLKNNVPGGIRWRGNGTLTYDKKAYRIKFSSKNNLLGLNNGLKAKSWVLLADYADQSMMRNLFALNISNSLFNYSNNYASSYQHVNLYLNEEYQGVYLLAEQQQTNAGRINISEPSEDYTGTDIGYLLELDCEKYAKEKDYYFLVGNTGGNQIGQATIPQEYYSIKSDIYDDAQVTAIQKYLENVYYIFRRAIKDQLYYTLDDNHDVIDSSFDNAYDTLNAVIDLESLFKTYLLHELMKNVDVGYSSFYLFVDFKNNSPYHRLTFGAPWDFDWSSGNANRAPYQSYEGAYNASVFDNNHMNPWLYMLSLTDFFETYMQKYYQVFLDSGIFDNAINYVSYETSAFKDEFASNYAKWGNLGQITPAYTPNEARDFHTHQDAVNHFLNWIKERKKVLDNLFK